jgi:hypothetical protein
MATEKKSTRKVITNQVEPCPKCGNTDPWIGMTNTVCPGKINPQTPCHYSGKHIGECSCGFTLLSERDIKCPRCGKKVVKCKNCGAAIVLGATCSRCGG